jgi:hypothetical protein
MNICQVSPASAKHPARTAVSSELELTTAAVALAEMADCHTAAFNPSCAHLEKVMVLDVEPGGSNAALSVATTSPDLKELACRKAAAKQQLVHRCLQAVT